MNLSFTDSKFKILHSMCDPQTTQHQHLLGASLDMPHLESHPDLTDSDSAKQFMCILAGEKCCSMKFMHFTYLTTSSSNS